MYWRRFRVALLGLAVAGLTLGCETVGKEAKDQVSNLEGRLQIAETSLAGQIADLRKGGEDSKRELKALEERLLKAQQREAMQVTAEVRGLAGAQAGLSAKLAASVDELRGLQGQIEEDAGKRMQEIRDGLTADVDRMGSNVQQKFQEGLRSVAGLLEQRITELRADVARVDVRLHKSLEDRVQKLDDILAKNQQGIEGWQRATEKALNENLESLRKENAESLRRATADLEQRVQHSDTRTVQGREEMAKWQQEMKAWLEKGLKENFDTLRASALEIEQRVRQSDSRTVQGREEMAKWQQEMKAWLEKSLKENFDTLRGSLAEVEQRFQKSLDQRVQQSDVRTVQGREEMAKWQQELRAWLEKTLKENFEGLRKESTENLRRATAELDQRVKQSDAQASQGRDELAKWQREMSGWVERTLKENFGTLQREVQTLHRDLGSGQRDLRRDFDREVDRLDKQLNFLTAALRNMGIPTVPGAVLAPAVPGPGAAPSGAAPAGTPGATATPAPVGEVTPTGQPSQATAPPPQPSAPLIALAPGVPPVPAVPTLPSPGLLAAPGPGPGSGPAAQPTQPAGTTAQPPARAPAPPRPATTVARAGSPDEIYRAALDDYVKGKYDLAMAGFNAYVTTYPQSGQVGSARYWLGETYLAQKKYREALQEFDVVLRDFPKSDKAPSALLKKAFAHRDLGQAGEACAALRDVTKKYKGSREARIGQGELSRANCR